VLAWIFRRCEGSAEAVETPIGLVPPPEALDTDGLDLAPEALEQLLTVDPAKARDELPQIREHLVQFGDRLPTEMRAQLDALVERLG
jgi:phosphoenolpyruvate carboxykinase (GTP)